MELQDLCELECPSYLRHYTRICVRCCDGRIDVADICAIQEWIAFPIALRAVSVNLASGAGLHTETFRLWGAC